jgi:hypothetical protein
VGLMISQWAKAGSKRSGRWFVLARTQSKSGVLLFGATINCFAEFLQKLYYISYLLAGQSRSGMKG